MLCINKEEDLEGLNDNVKDLFLNIDIEIVLPPRLKSLTICCYYESMISNLPDTLENLYLLSLPHGKLDKFPRGL